MADASEYLVEVGYLNASGVAGTLYLSCGGYTTEPGDSLPNRYYEPRISEIGPFTQNIYASGKTLGGESEIGYGSISAANANGELDAWLDYAFDGQPLVIKQLPSHTAPYSTAVTLFSGTVERLDADDAWVSFRLRVYDRRRILDRPIQTNLFAGTTLSGGATAEGTADLKDRPKPLLYGRVFNIPAVLVNAFDLIYQVNDGPVSSIIVYDGGVPLTQVANHSTLSALQSASLTGGEYITCNALGLFRIGSSPSKEITADVYQSSTASANRAGAIARAMLLKAGILVGSIDTASANALDAAAPYECGIWINEVRNTNEVITEILESVGGWMAPNTLGVYTFGQMAAPLNIPVATIDYSTDIILTGSDGEAVSIVANPDTDGGLPAWRVVLTYARVYQTQDATAVHGCVDDEYRAFLAKETREVKAQSATTQTRHILSPELRLNTLLTTITSATSEAARRLAMYSVRRDVIKLTLLASDAAPMLLGATVRVILPRFGYESGKYMVVIGREYDMQNERVTLTLWG